MILLTIFVKHIFVFFFQTSAEIWMKFASYIHLSKVTQVYSNQVCMTYFHQIMLLWAYGVNNSNVSLLTVKIIMQRIGVWILNVSH